MPKDNQPLCSNCIHSQSKVYIDLWNRRRGGRNKVLLNYILRKAYSQVHCKMVKKDKENFPHKLAELANWDDALLPQHCGHYERRPAYLVFNGAPNNWAFIGAYSTPEMAEKAEASLTDPRVFQSLVEFKQDVKKCNLEGIARNMIVDPRIDGSELTHEFIWMLLQTQLSDNDTFDMLSVHDYIRSIFKRVNSMNKFEVMSRGGMYKMSTLRTVIGDLRNPKYSRGPTMDIKPLKPRERLFGNHVVPLDGTWENEKKLYEAKIYVRVK